VKSPGIDSVFVTGGGGYIGTVLVPMLLDDGYKVRVLDRFFFGEGKLPDHDNLEIIKEDARHIDASHLAGMDAVIDLVAISNDPSGELFKDATMDINFQSRFRTAKLAKEAGAKRYVLPSSCSNYGYLDEKYVADETSALNPLTTYSKANAEAEAAIMPLADENFCPVALRQGTVFGYSPRLRFDLAVNGMTYGAWKTGKLPLMRDGKQWRPMIHIRDTSRAQMMMLGVDADKIRGEIFNTGSDENVYQIGPLGQLVADTVPGDVEVEWYGDVDHRSYRVAFDKISAIGFDTEFTAVDGVNEIIEALEAGDTDRTTETITLEWYAELVKWQKIIKSVERYGGIIEIDDQD
jgi:nucleoside-diphosphate-sugar epimerase